MSALSSRLAGRRILVVEDEYFIAMETKRWLQAAGATVLGPVPSVEQAFDLIENDAIDAAVLDVNLGDGDTVYLVADKLAGLEVPCLFATGDVTVVDGSGYRRQPCLEKPYSARDLVETVAKLFG